MNTDLTLHRSGTAEADTTTCECYQPLEFIFSIWQRIFGSYLEQKGFIEQESDLMNGILYACFDLFLEVSCDAEPSFDFSRALVLEFWERPYDEEIGCLADAPAWQELPVDSRMRGCWIFQTEEELEAVLLDMRSKLMEAAEKHLWLSQDALKMVIGAYRLRPNLPISRRISCSTVIPPSEFNA